MTAFLIFIAYVFLGIVAAVASWMYIASLISFACTRWWDAREAYRKKMDGKVASLMNENFD